MTEPFKRSAMTDRELEQILFYASLAPSPDNNQPWIFHWSDDELKLRLDKSRMIQSDPSGFFDLLSLGSVLENIHVAASLSGKLPNVSLFPQQDQPDLVVKINFREGARQDHNHPYLKKRHTNRKNYFIKAIGPEILQSLTEIASSNGSYLYWVTERAAIGKVAQVVSNLDKMRFKHRSFRRELSGALRFSRRSARLSNDGLLVEALELPAGAALMLRLLRYDRLFQFLTSLGILEAVQFVSRQQTKASAALGLLCINSNQREEIVRGGQIFQKIWLDLTRHGLAMQPLGAYPLFRLLAENPESDFSTAERVFIRSTAEMLAQEFGTANNLMHLMLFRVGYAPAPSAVVSYRLPINCIESNSSPCPDDSQYFDYQRAFIRNIGLYTIPEQLKLRETTVAIPGLGGVGGAHLLTLARMGIGGFNIADYDKFTLSNFNRQVGATCSSIGQTKTEVMTKAALQINPQLRLGVWNEAVQENNLLQFLKNVDIVVDSIDAFNLQTRRIVFNTARKLGIPVVTAGPIGFSCCMLTFMPDSMSFEDYFNITDSTKEDQNFAKFLVGLAPNLKPYRYIDFELVDKKEKCGPSSAAAVTLCAGIAATEVMKIILKRGPVFATPYYHYFDPFIYRFNRGKLPFGNRGIVQQIKVKLMQRALKRSKS